MLGFLGAEATPQNYLRFDREFKCQRCASCCQGIIFSDGCLLFPDEVERLAIEARLSKRQFKDRHTYAKDGKRFLKLPCLFYKDGCSIYSVRPRVCHEFPLNQLVRKNGKFEMTVNMDCPGGKELGDKYAVKVQI